MQLINDGLMDIASKRLVNEDTAVTDLIEGQRYYDLPPGLLKIGYTKKLPEERAKQISAATGVAMPYKVEWAYQCFNGETVEREVHHKLKPFRVNNNKEFFQISLEEAKETINLIGNKFK